MQYSKLKSQKLNIKMDENIAEEKLKNYYIKRLLGNGTFSKVKCVFH